MPFPADGVDVLRRMTERQEEANRNAEEARRVFSPDSEENRMFSPDSEEKGSFLGTLFKLLLLAFLLHFIWATGSTP